MNDDDDDFGFSDHDLDDLPAHALQHLEASAIRATQHPTPAAPSESDYGLEDGDEVVNLDDELYHDDEPLYPASGHTHGEEQPRRSQADPGQLLQRIQKVRSSTCHSHGARPANRRSWSKRRRARSERPTT